MLKHLTKVGITLAVTLFWLMVWQGAATLVNTELLLPSPLATLKALFALLQTSEFYKVCAMSLIRVLSGYIAGVFLGVLFGVLCAFSKIADALLKPLNNVVKATPVSSIIILVLLWLSVGTVPTFIIILIVTPIIGTSIYEGITSTDPLMNEMADFFKVPKLRKLKMLYWETVKSRFFAACITGIGFAWKAGVAAEVLATPRFSIGARLYESKIYLETPDLFAWTLAVILLSIVFERLIIAYSNKRKSEVSKAVKLHD